MEYKPRAYPWTGRVVTQEILDAILEDIRKGSPKKHAAEANGISERHFYHMLARGIVDIEMGELDTIHAKLCQSLRKIENDEMQWCRQKARENENGHKGAQWTLEHAYWRYYGKDANAKELAEEIDRLKADLKGVDHDKVNHIETEEDTE